MPTGFPLVNTQAQVCVSVQPRNRSAGLSLGTPCPFQRPTRNSRGANAGGQLAAPGIGLLSRRGATVARAAPRQGRADSQSEPEESTAWILGLSSQRARSVGAGTRRRRWGAPPSKVPRAWSTPRAGRCSSARGSGLRAPAPRRGADRCRCSRSSSPRRSGRPTARSCSGRGCTGSCRNCR